MTLDLGEQMSNLYMTTEEFAALVVEALHEQNYFKRESKNHPYDIAISFATVGESIGTAMSWAISKEHQVKKDLKQAMMATGNLSKNISGSHVLPIDDEIAPALLQQGESIIPEESLGYSEWKRDGYL
jgi:hypothetical protein